MKKITLRGIEGTNVYLGDDGAFYVEFASIEAALNAGRASGRPSAATAAPATPAAAKSMATAQGPRRGRRPRKSPEQMAEEQQKVFETVKQQAGGEGVAVSDLEAALHLPKPDISRHLKQLVDDGRLMKRGERRNTRYFAAGEVAGPAGDEAGNGKGRRGGNRK